jgi:hypothetical protein
MRFLTLALIVFVAVLVAAGAASSGRQTGFPFSGVRLSAGGADVGASLPQVALDAHGDAFAIWMERRPTSVVTEAAIRRAGGSWGPAVPLASGGFSQLAVDGRGDAVVAGLTLATREGIFAVYRPAGGRWGPARLLTDPNATSTSVGRFSPAIDDSGRAIVAWSDGNQVRLSSRGRDGPWQTRVLGSGADPAAALDAHGDALVAWHVPIESDGRLLAAWKPRGRSWQRPQLIPLSGNAPVTPAQPQLALDSRGNATVLWTSWTSDTAAVSVAQLGRVFSRPQQIGTTIARTAGPRLAVAANGRAAIIFIGPSPGSDIDGPVSVTTRFRAGQPFRTPVELSQRSALDPAVAINPSGRVLALWTQSDGSPTGQQLSLAHALGAPSGRFAQAETLAAIGADCLFHRCQRGGTASVALGPSGRAIVAWVEKPDPRYDVGGAVFAATFDVSSP